MIYTSQSDLFFRVELKESYVEWAWPSP
jgi:hypothetical protein